MIVVDTSIALKWLSEGEGNRDLALSLLNTHLRQQEEIIALDLLYIEAANALATKNISTPDSVNKGMQLLFRANLKKFTVTYAQIIETALLAKKYKTTVYDMLYAVIAKELKCTFITADEQFVKKTQFPFVKLLQTINL